MTTTDEPSVPAVPAVSADGQPAPSPVGDAAIETPLAWLIMAYVPASLIFSLGWFGFYTYVNGYLAEDLHYTNQQWTAATLWFTGGLLVLPFVCLAASSRVGRRATVIAGMAMCALSYVGFALTTDPVLMRVLFVTIAATQSAAMTTWIPLVAVAGGKRPGRALVIWQIVGLLVGVATLASGGHLLAATGYRKGFLVLGGICAACALAFSVASKRLVHGQVQRAPRLGQLPWRQISTLVAGPFIVIVLLGICVEPFNYHTANQLWPNLARAVAGFDKTTISDIVAIGRVPALMVLLVMARVVDRIHIVRWYSLAIIMVACCVMTMGLFGGRVMIVVGYLGFYVFNGGVWGSNMAAINASVAPHLRDLAFVIMQVAAVIAVLGVGFVHNRMLAAGMSLPSVFTWCGICAASGGAILLVYSLVRRLR